MTSAPSELIDAARSWVESDPDPDTRAELTALIDANDIEALGDRLAEPLGFGTAGIRGEVGAGPARMNRAVVIRTTAGLAAYLIEKHEGPPLSPVVVGFDARPSSRQFAEDTIGVLAAAGIAVAFFPDYAPTPLVAFAAKHMNASAGVVVTASHNPPSDNGYKVYGGNAAQIIPPVDAEIAAAIAGVGPAGEVPRLDSAMSSESPLLGVVAADILDDYWNEVSAARPMPTKSSLRIVYTPIHGVGGSTLVEIMGRAGHEGVLPVSRQFDPDGAFPTVSFPNPEEEGALDLALSLADETEADLVIANDPDADRLAVAIPSNEGWRRLSGNDVGVLLGDFVLRHHQGPIRPIVINSIVSSPMLSHIARAYDARHETTLTGFKWIANAGLALEEAGVGEFVFGYEEALGYTVGHTVRDKDGISAAVVFADLYAGLIGSERTIDDLLAELWAKAGIWASAQRSLTIDDPDGEAEMAGIVDRFAHDPPSEVGGRRVESVNDFRTGAERRPDWLGAQSLVEVKLDDGGRMLMRPSGTEPKLKVYVDLTEPIGGRPTAQQEKLAETADELAGDLISYLS